MSEGAEEDSKPVVNFVFLTRSGNKQQYNSVEMPVDSELVTKLRTREEVHAFTFSSFDHVIHVCWFLLIVSQEALMRFQILPIQQYSTYVAVMVHYSHRQLKC